MARRPRTTDRTPYKYFVNILLAIYTYEARRTPLSTFITGKVNHLLVSPSVTGFGVS